MNDRPPRRAANRRFHTPYGTDLPGKPDSLGGIKLERGTRLQVYWPDDQAWYFGKVECYNGRSGKHVIRYDDNDKEELDLDKEVWKMLLEPPPNTQEGNRESSKRDVDYAKKQPKTGTTGGKKRERKKAKSVVALDANGIHESGREDEYLQETVDAKAALMANINENVLGGSLTSFQRKNRELEDARVDTDDPGIDQEEEGARALTDLFFHPTAKRRKTEDFTSVGDWLTTLGLAKYDAQFQVHDVDLETLPYITMEDLREIGVPTVGHRRKLLINLPMP